MKSCICNRRYRRISIDNHELYDGSSISEWIEKIRNIFKYANLKWSISYELFITDVYELYHRNIPFHNHTHAYDVLQLGVCLLVSCKVLFNRLSYNQRFTFCAALLCHDIDHRGFTNYQIEINESINTKKMVWDTSQMESDSDDVSSVCSSSSHNEKHHIYTTCKLLKKHNIMYDKALFGNIVSHTDLILHKTFVEHMTNDAQKPKQIENQLVLLMKLADIGHIFRPWKTHLHFVHAINMERDTPLNKSELPKDTLCFNATFVYSLLVILKEVDTSLYKTLLKKYDVNRDKWTGIHDFLNIQL